MKKNLFLYGIIVASFLFLTVRVSAKEYKEYTIGQEIKFNPVTGEYCNSGDDCYTFNVINTDKYEDYIEMMLNFNLIESSSLNSTISVHYLSFVNEIKERTKSWKGIQTYTNNYEDLLLVDAGEKNSAGYYSGIVYNFYGSKARLISAKEVADITAATTSNGDKFIHDYYQGSQNYAENPFIFIENKWMATNINSNSGYWTITPSHNWTDSIESPSELWVVKSNVNGGKLTVLETNTSENDNIGLRPVVKIKKAEKTDDDSEPSEIETTTSKKIESTLKQEKNPSTSDSILNIITIMVLIGASSLIMVKKAKDN